MSIGLFLRVFESERMRWKLSERRDGIMEVRIVRKVGVDKVRRSGPAGRTRYRSLVGMDQSDLIST